MRRFTYHLRARPEGLIVFLLLLLTVGSLLAAPAPMPQALPPVPPSPIEQFRQWLRLSPGDRQTALAEWPAAKRAVILAKLQAYEALPADERERRLRMLELRWYMRPLMDLPPAERNEQVALVPPRLQQLVRERLEQWDRVDPSTRKQMLEREESRELVTNYFIQLQRGRSQEEVLSKLDETKREQLQQVLQRWSERNSAEQQRLGAQLAGFFELSKEKQSETLGDLPEPERQEMQKTLDAFGKLSPSQRRACVDSFQKFAMMSPTERGQFLRNAARWQAMTQQERDAWKNLVTKLPPLPPEPAVPPPTPGPVTANRRSVASTNEPGNE